MSRQSLNGPCIFFPLLSKLWDDGLVDYAHFILINLMDFHLELWKLTCLGKEAYLLSLTATVSVYVITGMIVFKTVWVNLPPHAPFFFSEYVFRHGLNKPTRQLDQYVMYYIIKRTRLNLTFLCFVRFLYLIAINSPVWGAPSAFCEVGVQEDFGRNLLSCRQYGIEKGLNGPLGDSFGLCGSQTG